MDSLETGNVSDLNNTTKVGELHTDTSTGSVQVTRIYRDFYLSYL